MSEELELLRQKITKLTGDRAAILEKIAGQDASREKASIASRQTELERVEADLMKLRSAEAQLVDVFSSRESDRSEALARWHQENEAYWFRRFHVSLAIANGTAFAALASNLFDVPDVQLAAATLYHPLLCFGVGLILAGVIPVALYLRWRMVPWLLAASSAIAFTAGIVIGLKAVFELGALELVSVLA